MKSISVYLDRREYTLRIDGDELGVTTQAAASRLRRDTETVVGTTPPGTRPLERITYKHIVYKKERLNRPTVCV